MSKLDGTGDYLSIPESEPEWNFGSQDWEIRTCEICRKHAGVRLPSGRFLCLVCQGIWTEEEYEKLEVQAREQYQQTHQTTERGVKT